MARLKQGLGVNISAATVAFDISPSNDNDLAQATRGIYVGTSGTLKVDMLGGGTVTFTALAAGIIHPICVARVYATGTDADDIIGVY